LDDGRRRRFGGLRPRAGTRPAPTPPGPVARAGAAGGCVREVACGRERARDPPLRGADRPSGETGEGV